MLVCEFGPMNHLGKVCFSEKALVLAIDHPADCKCAMKFTIFYISIQNLLQFVQMGSEFSGSSECSHSVSLSFAPSMLDVRAAISKNQ